MWQILGFFVVVALIVVALKIALIFLFLAGLIFRPKETLSLLAVLGLLALVRNYPTISYTIIGVAIVIALSRYASRDDKPPPPRLHDDGGG